MQVEMLADRRQQQAADARWHAGLPHALDVEGEAPEARGYVEWPVHPALADHVVCAWHDAPNSRRQPVLPDGCIDLVWDGSAIFVAGPDTRATPIASAGTFVGIRFRPGAAPSFLGVPASELLDVRVTLSELWGKSASELAQRLVDQTEVATHLFDSGEFDERLLRPQRRAASFLEAALLQRLATAKPSDHLVEEVVYE